MPRGDGTGPRGMGAMTGRAAGFCAGYGVPGYANPLAGAGFGRGWGYWGRGGIGGGRGHRNWFYATGLPGWMRFGGFGVPAGVPWSFPQPDPEWEKKALRSQADALQSQLNMILTRLGDREKSETED